MAHHQHHGPEYEAQLSRSLSTRPTSPHATSMPSISEDETLAECDEPPDVHAPVFSKAIFSNMPRRQSLLTRALHTDSEHDEDHFSETYFSKLPSVSSSCSNPSVRSNGDFTSDDGHHSPSTRPSTPGSPRSVMSIPKLEFLKPIVGSHQDSDEPKPLQLSSPAPVQDPVEATLGRRRCIMFSCGRKDKTDAPKQDSVVKPQTTPEPAPAPRKSIIRFACPFKADKAAKESAPTARVPSPAPPVKSISTAPFRRRHRDSDTTIRNESPTTPRAQIPQSPRNVRRFSQQSDIGRTEACRFHEFASEEETQDDWTQESTCYKSRLTVDDTLKKERDIRRLAEEADEEEALEQDSNDEDDFDSSDSDCSDVSDTGFHSDDEEGFAESDDEDDDSDYEWWAPRKSRARSPYIGGDVFRPVATRTYSNSSYDSDDSNISPGKLRRLSRRHVRPVQIRPGTPELPDSTDFVCGTLDEDRPMEAAYVSCVTARKAAKHRIVPQDIDPSFPVSDPEIGSDDDEVASDGEESEHFMHGKIENIDHDEEPRGRRMHSDSQRRSPVDSPLRPRSPPPKKTVHRSPPPKKSCAGHRSPAPVHLFNLTSPRRLRSPVPAHCMTSPPPSRRGSMLGDGNFGIAFLSNRSGELTHTASLPRSPHPMARRSQPSELKFDDEEDSDGSATDKPTDSHRYTRGAIDIAQGLERKRLKRREKFYQKYCRKQEKCERKGRTRPPPGKGAQRMRQIGLECAIYHGKRMLSI